ncbi:MAG TPA: hypothetical protein VF576_01610 [Rubricoccaceae bacterium]|jgi:hypothetical protein
MPRKKPGPPPDKSAVDFVAALQKARGVKAAAARALKVSRPAVDSAIERWSTVRAAYEEAREAALDDSEGTIFALRDDACVPASVRLAAAQFHLRTVGRGRGYGDRLALDFDPKGLTDEQLAAVVAGREPDAP